MKFRGEKILSANIECSLKRKLIKNVQIQENWFESEKRAK